MNKTEMIKKFVVTLADAYNVEMGKTRFQAYAMVLSEELPEQVNLNKLFTQLLKHFNFFPSVAEILKFANPKSSTKEQAIELVMSIRNAVAKHGQSGAYEALGEYAAWYLRNVMKVGTFDLCNGNVDLNNPATFAQWRDMAEAHFRGNEREERQQVLSSGEAKELLGEINKELVSRSANPL